MENEECRILHSPLIIPFALSAVRRRLIRVDHHVDRQVVVLRQADFQMVRSRFEAEPLEDAVEVVHDADVVAVHVDRRLFRLDLQAHGARAIVTRGAGRVVRRIPAEPGIVCVVAAVVTAGPPGIAGDDHSAVPVAPMIAARRPRRRRARGGLARLRLVALAPAWRRRSVVVRRAATGRPSRSGRARSRGPGRLRNRGRHSWRGAGAGAGAERGTAAGCDASAGRRVALGPGGGRSGQRHQQRCTDDPCRQPCASCHVFRQARCQMRSGKYSEKMHARVRLAVTGRVHSSRFLDTLSGRSIDSKTPP